MQTYSLQVKRIINAPVEKVFKAWTDQDQAKAWLSPESHTVDDAQIEAKTGGIYKIVMRDSKGNTPTTIGHIKELVPNKKLVFTWEWKGGNMGSEADGETIVSLEFKAVSADKTELTLTHELFKSEKSKQGHTQGWESVYNRLEKFLAA